MSRPAKVIVCVVLLLILVSLAVIATAKNSNESGTRIGTSTYMLEVANTQSERQLGLSGRQSMAQDVGMIFIFEDDGVYRFWMKDMFFALDMIWLNSEGRVIHIEESVSPDTYPTTFGPNEPSRYVVELNAGEVDSNDLQTGDILNIDKYRDGAVSTQVIYSPHKTTPPPLSTFEWAKTRISSLDIS
ncbi:MAG: DUF192 domain-containing protein [Patescibacteria group bacterium]